MTEPETVTGLVAQGTDEPMYSRRATSLCSGRMEFGVCGLLRPLLLLPQVNPKVTLNRVVLPCHLPASGP